MEAQGLPSEPITFGNGRVVLGGEATATVAAEDPGFFNYTDYQYSLLRNVRVGLTAEIRAHERLQILSEMRFDRGDPFQPYGLYARIRPWLSRRFDIQLGRVPPTFGAFGRGVYGSANMLIGYPLAYQYLTSLRSDALPRTAGDLLRMRGRGWLSAFPLGNTAAGPGMPLVNAFHWDTGIQAHGVNGPVEWTGAFTAGSLSNPRVDDDNDGRQVAGRLVLHGTPGLAIGVSAARGAFLSRTLQPFLDGTSVEEAVQHGFGLDAEYSAGRFLGRSEIIWSRWSMPATVTKGPLAANSFLAEARYRFLPGLHLAVRAERLGFNRIVSNARDESWEAPVQRYEAGIGYSVVRNVMLKASWQRNLRDAGRVRRETLGAAQIVYWF